MNSFFSLSNCYLNYLLTPYILKTKRTKIFFFETEQTACLNAFEYSHHKYMGQQKRYTYENKTFQVKTFRTITDYTSACQQLTNKYRHTTKKFHSKLRGHTNRLIWQRVSCKKEEAGWGIFLPSIIIKTGRNAAGHFTPLCLSKPLNPCSAVVFTWQARV